MSRTIIGGIDRFSKWYNPKKNDKDMKKVIMSLLLMATSSVFAFGQTSSDTTKLNTIDRLVVDAYYARSFNQHNTKNLALGIDLGYKVLSRLSVLFCSEYRVGLYKGDGNGYIESSNIGGGLSFSLVAPKYCTKWSETLDLVGKVTTSVGNLNWKNTAYDIGLRWHWGSKKAIGPMPFLSMGYTHINSHTTGICDYNLVYGALGILF